MSINKIKKAGIVFMRISKIKYLPFSDINLQDAFFGSLKKSYSEFDE